VNGHIGVFQYLSFKELVCSDLNGTVSITTQQADTGGPCQLSFKARASLTLELFKQLEYSAHISTRQKCYIRTALAEDDVAVGLCQAVAPGRAMENSFYPQPLLSLYRCNTDEGQLTLSVSGGPRRRAHLSTAQRHRLSDAEIRGCPLDLRAPYGAGRAGYAWWLVYVLPRCFVPYVADELFSTDRAGLAIRV